MLYALVGAIAGIINIIGLVPYIRDIFRHKTKPERGMWWIYTGLFALLFAAQLKAGAHWLLLVTGTYVLSGAVVAVLSLRYGYGRFHTRDSVSLLVAAGGLVLWLLSDKPLVAILMVVIVDIAGFWLTLVKTWYAPHSETLIYWELAFVSALLSIFSVETWTFEVIVYPLYAILGTAFIVWLIKYRRTKVIEDIADF